MVSQEQLLEEILARVDQLPNVPSVALQVNALLADPETDAQVLAEAIMKDPALTAQILKLCNSAEYGFARKIGTIREAVSILGYNVLKRVIFTIISHGFLNRPIEGYALEQGALWENALTCGAYARHIATQVKFKDPELAMVSALLRDIGKIALEGYVQGKQAALEDVAVNQKCSFIEAEVQVLGVSHTLVGARLASRWNLPDTLVHVIVHHHEPSLMPKDANEEDKKLVAIVHMAEVFTMMSGTGVGIDGLMYPLDTGIFEILKISEEQQFLETLYAQLLDLHEEIQNMSLAMTAT
jgi:putative nucleotidyltransferase with HDIG domain